MKLFILYAQRTQRYAGEFSPEPLEVADELTVSENPSVLDDLYQKHDKGGEFESLAWFDLDLPKGSQDEIRRRLGGIHPLGAAQSIRASD